MPQLSPTSGLMMLMVIITTIFIFVISFSLTNTQKLTF